MQTLCGVTTYAHQDSG